jgi:hypothetical protein
VLPVRRWHARQWQAATNAGSPAHVTLNCPQAQLACLVIILFSLACRDDSLRRNRHIILHRRSGA